MNLKISKETKELTNICPNSFACLSDENHTLCKVERAYLCGVHYISWKKEGSCCYKLKMKDGNICFCPVRNEIYQRYWK